MTMLLPWQKVVLKNYGMIKTENIAKIISVEPDFVNKIAKSLGLTKITYNDRWAKDGFVTIIRNNWDLLSIDDIALLLDLSTDELKKLLVEYDFLDIKLGAKPSVNSVKYYPLTNEQEEITDKVRDIIEENYISAKVMPFDFFTDKVNDVFDVNAEYVIKERFTSSYCAKYSGSLLDDEISDYSEEYLKRLKATGTNGIWLSDTLRNLALFPFDESLSPDYKIRVKNLKKLTERCDKYGIGVYLYINEPRCLPEEFFIKYPHLKGQKTDEGNYCMCTSVQEVQDYLFNAVKSLAENVPLLKAVMTITMSENPTHCYSRHWLERKDLYTDCPNCIGRHPAEIVAEINNTISRALKSGNGKTKLIANVWGWADFSPTFDDMKHCIDLHDKDIELLCVSEYRKKFVRGGVEVAVGDYSISVVGPSELATKILTYAKQTGHKIWTKIQLNNSWECSAVPYIPVFNLMEEHVNNVKKLGADGLMMGWSLGGYTGGVLSLCSYLCQSGDNNSIDWYKKVYGDDYKIVKEAVDIFSDAFTNFPFSVDVIYFAGHNLGPANLWSIDTQARKSTMVCYTFEDYELWAKPYGIDIFIDLCEKLINGWEKGLKVIERMQDEKLNEFKNCAIGTYCHLKSALNLAKFVNYKKNKNYNKLGMISCIESEEEVTKLLYNLISVDAKIGFEMTNHYYYNENILLEKLVNLNDCKQKLQ